MNCLILILICRDIGTPERKTKSKRRRTNQTPIKTTNEESGKENMGFEDDVITQAEVY